MRAGIGYSRCCELSYDLKATPKPSWVIIVKPLIEPPCVRFMRRGCKVALVDVVRNHPKSANPMIKSNNLGEPGVGCTASVSSAAPRRVMRNDRGELDGVRQRPPTCFYR